MSINLISDAGLAAAITRNASKQTYYTVRFLVDKPVVNDAYRAYAYFRWVDDRLDTGALEGAERLAFLRRQQTLMGDLLLGRQRERLAPEERLLQELLRGDRRNERGLIAYVRNMMGVMSFDAERRGRLISERELDDYTLGLATAVTEALHHFIGRKAGSPHGSSRYQAGTGAHIAHMLRDMVQDVEEGYYNYPSEILGTRRITAADFRNTAFRRWVQGRVARARSCFRAGRAYLAKVECVRCRLAGYAYIRRFEIVLDSIEREGYILRPDYPERKQHTEELRLITWALWKALSGRQSPKILHPARAR